MSYHQAPRTLLITGCSTGIGLYCAQAMQKRGWRVFVTARQQADIERLEAYGFESFYLDYADEASILKCSEEIIEKTNGALDVLFNNGAYGQIGAVEDLTADVLRKQFEANFFGWHSLTQAFLPFMLKRGKGRIIQCSSVLGFVAMKYRGAYIASKFALEGLSDTLRLEMDQTGVHVVSIRPGPIASAFRRNALQALRDHIDFDKSRHKERYQKRLDTEMNENKAKTRKDLWEMQPEAVFKKLVHACEAPSPKPYYHVTYPTYFMDFFRRFLPSKLLVRILKKISDKES